MKIYSNGKMLNIPGGSGGGGNNVYSTQENRIGTWVDGRPLYRKCFILGAVSYSAATQYIVPGTKQSDLNLHTLVDVKGIDSSYNETNSTFQHVEIIVSNSDINRSYQIGIEYYGVLGIELVQTPLKQGESLAGITMSFGNLIIILEYTKTTDQPET